MTLNEIWTRMLTRPAPKRPLRQLFLSTSLGFVLGLAAGQLVPPTWAFDQVPIRFDLPFRVAAISALGSFIGLGAMHLRPALRKWFVIAMLTMIPILFATLAALLYPIFSTRMIDFDALIRIMPIAWRLLNGMLAIVLLGAGMGWCRWAQAISRDEGNDGLDL